MLLRYHRDRNSEHRPANRAGSLARAWRSAAAACLMVFVALAASHQLTSQDASRPVLSTEANHPTDANAQVAMNEQQSKKASVDAVNVERRREIGEDSTRLLKLATDLKAQLDKTTKDTLSLGVIHKADEIERLAHSVREKMKLAMSEPN
jgi:predicted phage tail protein